MYDWKGIIKEKIKRPLRKTQYWGNCTACGRYSHKYKDCWHREGENVPKYHYCNKVVHPKTDHCNRTKEDKSGTNKNEVNNTNKYGYQKMKNHKEKDCHNKKKNKK